MKNHSPNSSSPVTGRRYWRSLDELADTPEFKDWLQREFPQGASELEDGVSRRHFVRIMSASFMLAGMGVMGAGCRRPVEKLEPFGKQQADYTFGEPQYFATAMPTRGGALPLVVKSYEGRPIKVEGNAEFPDSNGSTDRYAQASILDVYDPDRAKRYKNAGKMVKPEDAYAALDQIAQAAASSGGQGLAFLTDRSTSPSRRRLQDLISQKYTGAKWYAYEPVDSEVHERAATQAFGQTVRPVYHFEKAKVIVSLGSDFLGSEDDVHNSIRRFVQGRKPESGAMSRLYVIESLFTLTGAGADHRLRVSPTQIGVLAAAIQALVQNPGSATAVKGDAAKWITECAKDLAAAKEGALVVAGQSQPLEVHLLAFAINSALGAVGNTISLHTVKPSIAGTISDLAKSLNAGEVSTLVILGGNPVYNAPADLNWSATQRKAKTVVRLGYYEDETFAQTDWHIPAAHYLESWGDATTSDGTLVPVQPLIQPLFGGMQELEFLARIGGLPQTSAYEIVRATFGDVEAAWQKFLFNGFQPGSAAVTVAPGFIATVPTISPADPSASSLEVVFYRDAKTDDGRYANNGWMQEFPEPVTKITWDNAVLVSRKTARDLGVENGDLVDVTLGGRTVTGPIWTQPGMADYTLGLALGYGRTAAGRIGTGIGFNAYSIFAGSYTATGATVKKTGQTYVIATTQHHWSMEGRPAVREANWAEYQKEPNFAEKMHGVEPQPVASLYPNPLDEAKKTALHQWGLTVDLTSCVGCGTCVIACQSENNIPIVGKDQVKRGREMHWMRIDRYYTADPAQEVTREQKNEFAVDEKEQFDTWIDDVQAVNQPMLCQQCEAAPCESVCPVNATVHDQEGLNVMAYNRCIGTRYCSNNCPYKVRRFNYLDFNKRPLADLKGTLYPTAMLGSKTGGELDVVRWWNNPESGMREQDEWDLIKMVKNPDVTVRMRGVMEKCTYCTQRIEHAKIKQKAKVGQTGVARLSEAEGTVPKTACQQACPAGAIVFGDVSDPDSTVSKIKAGERNYIVLGDLLTKPRTSYQSRIRNPNPAMPDYREWPHSYEEYEKVNGAPYEEPAEKGNS